MPGLGIVGHGLVFWGRWVVFSECFLPLPPGSPYLPPMGRAAGGRMRGKRNGQSPAQDGGILPLCPPDYSEQQEAQLSVSPGEISCKLLSTGWHFQQIFKGS